MLLTDHAAQACQQEEMFLLVEHYYQSKLTRCQFCQQEGISLIKLVYWIGRYRQQLQELPPEPEPAGFIPFASIPEDVSSRCPDGQRRVIELHLGNGLLLRINRGKEGCLP